jgi:rubrerythrin
MFRLKALMEEHFENLAVADEAGLLRQAQALEETAARFYRDAAAKMPIQEVVRLFQRLVRENEQRKAMFGQAC